MSEIIKFPKKKKEVKCEPCCEVRDGKCWCPHIQWYLAEGCPFSCKHECDIYREMCGKRI